MTSTDPKTCIIGTRNCPADNPAIMETGATTLHYCIPGTSDSMSHEPTLAFVEDPSSHEILEPSVSDVRQDIDPDIHSHLWTPFFLLRRTLLAFIAFHLCVTAGLTSLIIIDRQNQGLASAQSSKHYLWTYGPTAILTFAATFWGQVEYQTRQVMPWAIMRTGPSKASKTLFIDYTSIDQISALFQSLKERHFPVTLAVFGSILIKLLIVISTSLLVLEEQPWMIKDIPVNATEVFSFGNWNTTEYTQNGLWVTLARSAYNLSYPPGTSGKQAVPSLNFDNVELGGRDVLEATLPQFQAAANCEAATITSISAANTSIDNVGVRFFIEFETQSCRFHDEIAWMTRDWPGHPTDYHFMDSHLSLCNETNMVNRDIYPANRRLVLYSALLTPSTSDFLSYAAETQHDRVLNTSGILAAIVCNPKIEFYPSPVMMDSRQMLLSSSGAASSEDQPPNLNAFDMIKKLQDHMTQLDWGSMLNMTGIGMEQIYSDRGHYEDIRRGWISMLISERVNHFSSLTDSDILRKTLINFLQETMAQMAKSRLLSPGIQQYKATIHTTQQRLRVRTFSIYWMLAILCGLMTLTAVLCAVAPRNVASRDIQSIGGLSCVLSRSSSLSTYFSGTGCLQLAKIRGSLGGKWCKSRIDSTNGHARFTIDLHGDDCPAKRSQVQEDCVEDMKWWRPFAISALHKTMVIIWTASLIVTLHILCYKSNISNGLLDVSNQGAVRYTWLYVPTLIMMLLQLVVGMISSTSSMILSYHELRHWPSSREKALLNDQSSILTVHALYKSIRCRQWPIIATSLSLLLNPILTIAAAGLYTAEVAPSSDNIQLQVNDTLLLKNTREWWKGDLRTDNVVLANLLLANENMSYPLWTLNGLVFPKVSTLEEKVLHYGEGINTFFDDQSIIRAPLKALRPSLNCSHWTEKEMNTTISNSSSDSGLNIQINPHHLPECTIKSRFEANAEMAIVETPQSNGSEVCSSLVLIYGWWNDTPSINVAICDGILEELEVETNFSLPSFKIEDINIHEKSAHRVENHTAPFDLLTFVANFRRSSNDPFWPHEADWPNGATDPVFDLMFRKQGIHTLRMNDIVGREGFPRLVETLEYYWRMIFSQALNLRSRSEIQGEKPIINGTLIRLNRYRLQQSEISTRILEVLLGVIGLCIAVSFWAMNTKEILPKNPCSIAAQASLLAGSSMLKEDVIPPGSEWCSDKELREKGVFDGLLFSMGWRGGADGEKRWFGIDVGKSDWSR